MRAEDPPGRGGRERGQTTLDFAIGVTVFLLTVAFVLSFIPGLLQPFENSPGSSPVTADRIATDLATGTLGGPADPYVLDPICTEAFFDTGASPPSDCRFDGTTIDDRLGYSGRANIFISLTGDADGDGTVDELCLDSNDHIAEEGSCSGPLFDTGDPTGDTSVTSARRVVSVDGMDAVLEVETS